MFSLWLDDTSFFLQAMAAVLSTNAAIKRLNLEYCEIHDAGVEARWSYFAAVKGSPCWRIQRLDLRSPGRGMRQITFEFDYDVAGKVFCDK